MKFSYTLALASVVSGCGIQADEKLAFDYLVNGADWGEVAPLCGNGTE